MNGAVVAALAMPAVREKLAAAGVAAAGSSAAELETLTRREYERFGVVAREAKIAID